MKAYVVESPREFYRHRGLMFVHPVVGKFVYANCPGKGVVRQSVEAFCAGRALSVVREALGPTDWLLGRIGSAPRRAYDWIRWNCEHFVSWVEEGEPSSPQLQFYSGLVFAGAVLWLATKGRAPVFR